MTQFGMVQAFNETSGRGTLRPLDGSADLGFSRGDFAEPLKVPPRLGSYLSFKPVDNEAGVRSAEDIRQSTPEQWHGAYRQFTSALAEPDLHPTIDHTFGLGAERVTIPLVLTAVMVGGAILVAVA